MKRIGLYGGSFDPIHFGHLNLSLELFKKHNLDIIFFCPANVSPLKKDQSFTPIHHRIRMIELAIEDIPYFQLLDIEAKRGGVSYTIDTLKELKEKYPEAELFLILGLDTVFRFAEWKSPEEILNIAKPLIGIRGDKSLHTDIKYYSFFEKGLTTTTILDISSTFIRNQIQIKNYIKHLVPAKVVDYIYENSLY